MNLTKKTFVYSSLISIIIVAMFVGYFLFMLPSLYVAHIMNRNLDSIIEIQRGYLETRSYDTLEVNNPTGTFTLEIPFTGNNLLLTGKFFDATIALQDKELLEFLNRFRNAMQHTEKMEDFEVEEFDFNSFFKRFDLQKANQDNPVNLQFHIKESKLEYKEVSSKFHLISKDFVVFESNVTDSYSYYTTYFSFVKESDKITITILPVMTPQMEEIRPVILGSLPMILAVAFFLVLILSQVFAKFIVDPIIRLSKHAEYVKDIKDLELEPLVIKGKDEIGALSETLNSLYQRLQDNYLEIEEQNHEVEEKNQELAVKNRFLAEENKRQEIFLRASSHQLKTPITAALLLVEGMINEIGKYKNVKEYLPQVKVQLRSMQKIVEDILYLNHCSKNLTMELVDLNHLSQECLSEYEVMIGTKSMEVSFSGPQVQVQSNRELLKKVVDNLLSNAIHHSPQGEKVTLQLSPNKLVIENFGCKIEDELLPHIFDAFVTSNSKEKGHGLGLYVVAYYVNYLGCQVSVYNIDGGVRAELMFNIVKSNSKV